MNSFRGAHAFWKKHELGTSGSSASPLAVWVLLIVLLFVGVAGAGPVNGTLHTGPDFRFDRLAALSCVGVYHVVRPGQTIYSIAALYGSTAYRIAACNYLRSYRVYVGQVLLVPTRTIYGRG